MRRWSPGLETANWRFSLLEKTELVMMALAIRLSGLAFLSGQESPNFRMRRTIFFLFIAVPRRRGIIMAIARSP